MMGAEELSEAGASTENVTDGVAIGYDAQGSSGKNDKVQAP